MFGLEPFRRPNRIGRTHRLWQMAGNRRGLGWDIQRLGPQDLMPPARHRILGRAGKGQEHIPRRILPRHLHRPRDLKGCIAIVQKGSVCGPQGPGYGRQTLVARGANRIKPLPLALHFAALQIQSPAQALRMKQADRVRIT